MHSAAGAINYLGTPETLEKYYSILIGSWRVTVFVPPSAVHAVRILELRWPPVGASPDVP